MVKSTLEFEYEYWACQKIYRVQKSVGGGGAPGYVIGKIGLADYN